MSWAQQTKWRLQAAGVFLLPAGIIALVMSVPHALHQFESRNWPSVAGDVESVVVEESFDAKNRESLYTGRVTFKYTVDGQTHTSQRINLSADSKRVTRDLAMGDVAKYQPGQQVTVFYDSADPSIAVLEKGLAQSDLILVIGGCVCVLIGSVMSVFAVQSFRRSLEDTRQAEKAYAARYAATEPEGPAAVPFDEDQPFSLSAIGKVQATYRPDMANALAGIVIALLLIVGGIGVAVFVARHKGQRPPATDDRVFQYIIVGLFGVVAPAGGLALLIWVSRLFRHRVIVGENGLAYITRGEAHLCTWDRILAFEALVIDESLPILRVPGASLKGTSERLIIHRNDGKAFTFTTNTVRDLNGLTRCLRDISRTHKIRWDAA